MKKLLHFFSFIFLVVISFPLALVPYKPLLKVGDFIGLLLFYIWKSRREIAIKNLSETVARGAIKIESSPVSIIRQNFKNLGRSAVEIIKIYYGFGGEIIDNVEVQGIENYQRAHQKGKGILIITGHCGNWELTGIAFSAKVSRVTGIARRIYNPFINRFVEKARQKYGNRVIYKQGALKKVLTSLKNNELVGILMDQSVIPAEGVVIKFLGKDAYTMKMPSMIARRTGAIVLPVFIRRKEKGHILEIGEQIDLHNCDDIDSAIRNDTIRFSSCIEEYIKQNPAEWLWIHRRWKRIKG